MQDTILDEFRRVAPRGERNIMLHTMLLFATGDIV